MFKENRKRNLRKTAVTVLFAAAVMPFMIFVPHFLPFAHAIPQRVSKPVVQARGSGSLAGGTQTGTLLVEHQAVEQGQLFAAANYLWSRSRA